MQTMNFEYLLIDKMMKIRLKHLLYYLLRLMYFDSTNQVGFGTNLRLIKTHS